MPQCLLGASASSWCTREVIKDTLLEADETLQDLAKEAKDIMLGRNMREKQLDKIVKPLLQAGSSFQNCLPLRIAATRACG